MDTTDYSDRHGAANHATRVASAVRERAQLLPSRRRPSQAADPYSRDATEPACRRRPHMTQRDTYEHPVYPTAS